MMRRWLRVLCLSVMVAMLLVSVTRSARAEYRAAFPYRDADFLFGGETNGGMVVVPDAVPRGEKAPLVVLLHGVNPEPVLHMWFGVKAYPDLSALSAQMIASRASVPFIFAAPSQTKGAMSGRHMWQDFDLDDFVRAVDAAVGARAAIDRDAVYVIGHSGAGCNPDGGLLRVARAPSLVVPRGILAIDTCMDEDSGPALGSAPESAKVWVRWQPEIWPRPLDRFRTTFKLAADLAGHAEPQIQCLNGLVEPVHIMILVDTFATVLPAILAGREIPPPTGPPCPPAPSVAAATPQQGP
jgi:hypothetical protein